MTCYKNLELLKIVAENHGYLKSKIVEAFGHLWGHNDAYSEPNDDTDKCISRHKYYWEDRGFTCHDLVKIIERSSGYSWLMQKKIPKDFRHLSKT